MRTVSSLLCALGLGVLSVACGGSSQAGDQTTPAGVAATPRLSILFDNGVDLIADPSALAGRWRDSWQAEFAERIDTADYLALVEVHTIRTDTNLTNDRAYRLSTKVLKKLRGDGVGDDLTLVVTDQSSGFATISSRDQQILRHPFVAFVKWIRQAERSVPNWHLSPATPEVVREVKAALGDDWPQGGAAVTVHHN